MVTVELFDWETEVMIRSFLRKHEEKQTVSFHMPGHKGKALYENLGYGDFLQGFLNWDVTEIPGADNLFQAEGIIRDTAQRYARLYHVDKSYLLINGTSGGLIAAIMAAVPGGKKLLMARNCHKAVFNGLLIAGGEPVYVYPESGEVAGPIKPEEVDRLLRENPDVEAVLLPSPNYYGICSDIEAIAEVTHRAGKILIVDQAHGAHLQFFHDFGEGEEMPPSAESCGADIVVNSIHKTLTSMTQSAVLNLQGDRVDRYLLEDKLQMIQSTSPSYILMTSLDINGDIIEKHGREIFRRWRRNLDNFYEGAKAIKGLRLPKWPLHDFTKINMDMGISGALLENLLIEKGIYTELHTGNILMAMTGIGNTEEDYDQLLDVLKNIDDELSIGNRRWGAEEKELHSMEREVFPIPAEKEYVPLEESPGRVCAGSVIPYPPGIPYICPGEKFFREDILHIQKLRSTGEKVIGVNELGQVLVGK